MKRYLGYVILYYLMGMLFLPNQICETGVFILGAWISPEELIPFKTIAEHKHEDLRAAVYTFSCLEIQRRKPFSETELNAGDFSGGTREAYSVLKMIGMVQELSDAELLKEQHTAIELKEMAKEKGISVQGTKAEIVARLQKAGYKLDKRKYRKKLFRFSEKAVKALEELRSDERKAITCAIQALKYGNYAEAVVAYRQFDRKWGFVHTSEKTHNICPLRCFVSATFVY